MATTFNRSAPVAAPTARHARAPFVFESASGRELDVRIRALAPRPEPVLITGQTGSGKEVVATLLHERSGRRGRLAVVHCGSIPADLFERELFGHAKGAFTGADRDRGGLIAAAAAGTLFLDELGELPLEHQVKLLRLLSEGTYRPVGAVRDLRADVRVIAATNRDIRQMLVRRLLREDFYARISVLEIAVPALRERQADVVELARRSAAEQAHDPEFVTAMVAAAAKLCDHDNAWALGVRDIAKLAVRASVDGIESAVASLEAEWAVVGSNGRGEVALEAAPTACAGPSARETANSAGASPVAGDVQLAPSPSPCVPVVASRYDDLAKLIQERLDGVGAGNVRAARRSAARALAPLLARCAVVERADIERAIGPCDARTTKANIAKLIEAALLHVAPGANEQYQLTPGVELRFILQRGRGATGRGGGRRDRSLDGEWTLLSPDTVHSARAGDIICVEATTRSSMLVSAALISHQVDASAALWLHVERPTQPGRAARLFIALDDTPCFEHVLVHATWPTTRGGRAVSDHVPVAIPSSTQLTRARRDALVRRGKLGFTYDLFLHHR